MAFRVLLAAALLASCAKDPPPPAARTDNAGPARPRAHIAGDNYKVDTSSTCASGTCTATIRLEATGEYHLNAEYPYKFKADSADGVTYKGSDGAGPNVFSKATGDFAKQTEKVGVMTVKLDAAKAQTITGVFKMSVCSAANCELENPAVAIEIAP